MNTSSQLVDRSNGRGRTPRSDHVAELHRPALVLFRLQQAKSDRLLYCLGVAHLGRVRADKVRNGEVGERVLGKGGGVRSFAQVEEDGVHDGRALLHVVAVIVPERTVAQQKTRHIHGACERDYHRSDAQTALLLHCSVVRRMTNAHALLAAAKLGDEQLQHKKPAETSEERGEHIGSAPLYKSIAERAMMSHVCCFARWWKKLK